MVTVFKYLQLSKSGGSISVPAGYTGWIIPQFYIFKNKFILIYPYNNSNSAVTTLEYSILLDGKESDIPMSELDMKVSYFDQDSETFYTLVGKIV
jgi:hypothetical protein